MRRLVTWLPNSEASVLFNIFPNNVYGVAPLKSVGQLGRQFLTVVEGGEENPSEGTGSILTRSESRDKACFGMTERRRESERSDIPLTRSKEN